MSVSMEAGAEFVWNYFMPDDAFGYERFSRNVSKMCNLPSISLSLFLAQRRPCP